MRNPYMQSRSQRREAMNLAGTLRGGKLAPVLAVPFLGSESGVVRQAINVELEPIAGRLITDITARVTCVYVPLLAADALVNAALDYPGNAEVFRHRLLAGESVFAMEPPTEISNMLGIIPRRIDGLPKVSAVARICHNVAVNFLRRRKYIEAAQIAAGHKLMTPALISDHVLDRFNAVLDPEDRIDGAVQLEGEIPIRGIGLQADKLGITPQNRTHRTTNSVDDVFTGWKISDPQDDAYEAQVWIEQDPAKPGFPNIRADFALGTGQQLSLKDFYRAERMDELTRLMRAIVDQNPEHGEDIVTRLVHGLHVETGKLPFTVYEKEVSLARGVKSGMDGPSLDVMQTQTFGELSFSVPIPANEFGGVLVTFLEIKPEEVVEHQPHPILSAPWELENRMADELALDPVPVYMRDLDSDVPQADEGTIAFYVGHNHLRRRYGHSGWNLTVDPTTVDHKSAMWRMAIPLSVSPTNILYPADLDHYPFALNSPTDKAVSYAARSDAMISSPMILGPTPIERLAIIDGQDVFGEHG